jgi:hypothetical protein
MTATVTRLATADIEIPHLELSAGGEVVISGRADAAGLPAGLASPQPPSSTPPDRAGPPRLRSSDAPELSQARRAWSDHLKTIDRLSAEVERTAIPTRRGEFLLKEALVSLASAESTQAAADAAVTARVAEAVRKGEAVLPAASVDTEAASKIDQARRTVNALRMALEELRVDQARHVAALENAKARGEPLLLEITVEFHRTHLDRWAEARDVFYAREAELYGLHELIGIMGRRLYEQSGDVTWLQKLETLRPPWATAAGHVELGPREISACSDRWSTVLHRLQQGDVAATLG